MANIELWFPKNIPGAQNVVSIEDVQAFRLQFVSKVPTGNHSSFIQTVPNQGYCFGFGEAL
ncbi:MAG TPA: hypothetical protein VM578_00775 [Candidatus Saccharimonadales bacterium]|nr:hypothetical protein [Candidatus Saccharimonadales bacterium]